MGERLRRGEWGREGMEGEGEGVKWEGGRGWRRTTGWGEMRWGGGEGEGGGGSDVGVAEGVEDR